MSDLVALIDCNNFFTSCETVFQPWLNDSPVVVLSSNDGCIIARSQKAKDCGIPMGAPYHVYKQHIQRHGIKVFSSNFSLYGEFSRRIHHILSQYCEKIEPYSIDEFFFMIPSFHNNKGPSTAHIRRTQETRAYTLASAIQDRIQQWLTIPTSIGIATTKSLAKIANKFAKRNHATTRGIHNLGFSGVSESLLASLAVEELWGISYKSKKKLNNKHIYTALDFYRAPIHLIRSLLSITGERIHHELKGESCLTLNDTHTAKKSIRISRSFGHPVTQKVQVQSALTEFVSQASEKLRAQHSRAHTLYVYIHTNPYQQIPQYMRGKMMHFVEALFDTNILVAHCRTLLEEIFTPGHRYSKAGVILMNLIPITPFQEPLFTMTHQEQSRELMDAVDRINTLYEKDTVFVGSRGTRIKETWSPRNNFRSPRYLTHWKELPIVHAS